MSANDRLRRFFIGLLVIALPWLAEAAEPDSAWKEQWDKAIKAAEQEGELVIYTLSEIGDVFLHSRFQKKFPKIKLVLVSARGGELVSRIMAERRAGKFLADIGNLGNTSPYRLYEAKVLEPIDSSFLLPEVSDPSKWWQGKQHYIDPDNKYILVYVGAPLFLVAYNTNLANPRELNPIRIFSTPGGKEKSPPSIRARADLRRRAIASSTSIRSWAQRSLSDFLLKWT